MVLYFAWYFQVQTLLGCHNALAFDLTAACSGFVLGLVTATRFIRGIILRFSNNIRNLGNELSFAE